MKYRLVIKMAFLMLFFITAFSLNAVAQRTDCSKTTDQQIVDAAYAKLEKSKFKEQLNHVNIRSKDGVVTIEGFAVKDKDSVGIENIVKKIKCVKSIVNDLKIGATGGCPDGTKPCGDTCIGSAETCNIRTRGN